MVKGVKDMKILIKNKKWETSFKTVKLICNVSSENKIFNISFNYNGKNIHKFHFLRMRYCLVTIEISLKTQ